MTNSEEPAHDARAEAIEAAIEARLTAFDQHRNELHAILRKVCERRPKTKSFDKNKSWRHLRFMAGVYLREQASVKQKQIELLRELGNALREARCKLGEARHHVTRGVLFVEWCEAHGNPDFTDPIIGLVENKFDDVVADVVAGLADLETAASRAVEETRQPPGRPMGTSVLQHDFIINLESVYRDITGKTGGAGPGPFVRFVMKFLEALRRKSEEQTVIKAIKAAKKREEKNPATSRWGRSLLAGFRGETPPNPRNYFPHPRIIGALKEFLWMAICVREAALRKSPCLTQSPSSQNF
jgi:hypothetical protein